MTQAWRDRLGNDLADAVDARVTVRIEAEAAAEAHAPAEFADDLLFGMWRDRPDMADVAGYIRHIRAPRFGGESSRNEP